VITRQSILIVAACLIVFAAAAALSLQAATGSLLPFDRGVAEALQEVPGGRIYEPLANAMALAVLEYGVLVAAAAWAWHAGDRVLAASVVLVVLARLLNTPLKEVIDRPRPDATDLVIRDPAEGRGFPSGHASTAVLVFGYASIVALRHAPRFMAALAVVLSLATMLLIGWDRVYDGAHWPSDVLGGYATGAALLIAAIVAPPVAVQLWHRAGSARVGQSHMRGLG
jgi:undecaprenyl-diphosphatase